VIIKFKQCYFNKVKVKIYVPNIIIWDLLSVLEQVFRLETSLLFPQKIQRSDFKLASNSFNR